jgi:hypothetical protein
MEVRIVHFDENAEIPYVDYDVFGLEANQLEFLDENLDERTSINGDILRLRVNYEEFFPFQSDIAKIKIDDFIAREEIEMNMFLSSFLEEM